MTLKRMEFRYRIKVLHIQCDPPVDMLVFSIVHGLSHETDVSCIWSHLSSIKFSVCSLSSYPICGGLDLIYLERPDLRRSIPGGSEDCGGAREPSKGVDQWWNCWFVKSCNRNGCSVIMHTICTCQILYTIYWTVLNCCPSTVSSHIFTFF